MPPAGGLDLGLRARAAQWYAAARDFYEAGDWYSATQAQRIACLMWHLADPALTWDEVVHC